VVVIDFLPVISLRVVVYSRSRRTIKSVTIIMDDSVDTTAVLVDSDGRQTTPAVTAGVVDDKQSPTVIFIPPENGQLGNPLVNSSVRLLQTIDGAVISFRDVCYQVQTTVRTSGCRCRKEPKHILKNVRLVLVTV